MFMLECRAVSWWYWLVIVALLTAGVAGWGMGFQLAIALAALQVVHFAIRNRSITAFPIQVRAGYLMALTLFFALPQSQHWLFWLPVIGTWATVIFGYCLMARLVSLLPWNRQEEISPALLRRTFLSAPTRGTILFPSP